jgi:hypothetical protein
MPRPNSTEYAPYFEAYIALVPEDDIVATMEAQLKEMQPFLQGVPESQGNVRHPPYTWSIKEVVGHLTDTERIFAYRALRFARGDATPLPGFDENAYVRAAEFDRTPLGELVSEFDSVRRSNLSLFRHFSEEVWTRQGTANGKAISVRALAYNIVGHARHHMAILRRRLSEKSSSRR